MPTLCPCFWIVLVSHKTLAASWRSGTSHVESVACVSISPHYCGPCCFDLVTLSIRKPSVIYCNLVIGDNANCHYFLIFRSVQKPVHRDPVGSMSLPLNGAPQLFAQCHSQHSQGADPAASSSPPQPQSESINYNSTLHKPTVFFRSLNCLKQ